MLTKMLMLALADLAKLMLATDFGDPLVTQAHMLANSKS